MSLDSKLPPDREDCFNYELSSPVENKTLVEPQKIGFFLSTAFLSTAVCGGTVGSDLGLYLSRLFTKEPIYFLDYVQSSSLGAAVGLTGGLLLYGYFTKGQRSRS